MAVADDGVNFGESGELPGGALGIATRHDDASVRILAANSTDEGAGLTVGFGGHAAGIYNDNMGSGRLEGGFESAAAQVGSDGLTVGAAGAAAEVFHMIFCHVA